MIKTAKAYLNRCRLISSQKRDLESIPTLPANASALRCLPDWILGRILDNEELAKDWEASKAQLDEACRIEDGTTLGVNPGDRRAVWQITRSLAPRRVLEIGTHVGASTSHIALAMSRSTEGEGAPPPRLVTIDIQDVNDPVNGYWKKMGLDLSPREMMGRLGCGDFVEFVTSRSFDYLDGCDEKFDLVFLDGDHSAPTVYQEIPRALKVLEEDGVILLHDYFPGNKPLWSNGKILPGPFLAVERLRIEGVPLRVIPMGELPWPTKLGSKITSLALLSRS